MIKLLIKQKGYFICEENNFNINSKQSYINLIITLCDFNFNIQFKDYIISIIKQINPKILNIYEECIYNESYIKSWFIKQGINLENDIIKIKDTQIPNFYKLNQVYNLIDLSFEFYHLLYKIYKPVIERGFSFYEAGKYTISNKDIVFDCGANMGLFAAYAASKGAKVYCFEPMSYIRNYLKQVQQLYPDNIIIVPYALGKFNQNELFKQTLNPGECRIKTPNTNEQRTLYYEKVKVINLDQFITENKITPTFIKMDIEGGEIQAFLGGENFFKKNKVVFSISLDHDDKDKQILPNLINSLNLDYNIFYFNKGDSMNMHSLFMLCK